LHKRETLVIVVRITLKALWEKHKEVMQTLLSMIEPTEKEQGCLSFHVMCDVENQTKFSLIEEWESREDLALHLQSQRFTVLLGTKNLLDEPLNIQIHTVAHSEGMESVAAVRNKP
jgi:quinol monooxygenase YgiN